MKVCFYFCSSSILQILFILFKFSNFLSHNQINWNYAKVLEYLLRNASNHIWLQVLKDNIINNSMFDATYVFNSHGMCIPLLIHFHFFVIMLNGNAAADTSKTAK